MLTQADIKTKRYSFMFPLIKTFCNGQLSAFHKYSKCMNTEVIMETISDRSTTYKVIERYSNKINVLINDAASYTTYRNIPISSIDTDF